MSLSETENANILFHKALTHLDWAVVVLRNGLGLQVALQLPVKIVLQETFQGFSVTAVENHNI